MAPARKPDTKLRWPGKGPLFESDLMNALGALLESSLGPLARYSTHQETEWETGTSVSSISLEIGSVWRGAIIRVGFKKNGERGAKYGHYSSRSLGHYLHQAWALGQIWHWSKSLSNVAEYCYQICIKTSRKVEGSLCKLLCIQMFVM